MHSFYAENLHFDEEITDLHSYKRWISELESLGLSVNKINEFNDLNEIRSLAEIIKEGFYQDQKSHNLQL